MSAPPLPDGPAAARRWRGLLFDGRRRSEARPAAKNSKRRPRVRGRRRLDEPVQRAAAEALLDPRALRRERRVLARGRRAARVVEGGLELPGLGLGGVDGALGGGRAPRREVVGALALVAEARLVGRRRRDGRRRARLRPGVRRRRHRGARRRPRRRRRRPGLQRGGHDAPPLGGRRRRRAGLVAARRAAAGPARGAERGGPAMPRATRTARAAVRSRREADGAAAAGVCDAAGGRGGAAAGRGRRARAPTGAAAPGTTASAAPGATVAAAAMDPSARATTRPAGMAWPFASSVPAGTCEAGATPPPARATTGSGGKAAPAPSLGRSGLPRARLDGVDRGRHGLLAPGPRGRGARRRSLFGFVGSPGAERRPRRLVGGRLATGRRRRGRVFLDDGRRRGPRPRAAARRRAATPNPSFGPRDRAAPGAGDTRPVRRGGGGGGGPSGSSGASRIAPSRTPRSFPATGGRPQTAAALPKSPELPPSAATLNWARAMRRAWRAPGSDASSHASN